MKPEIDAAVARVIDSAQFVLGPEVAAFEERFAEYCGVKHCTALNSGTSALHLALLAAGIGPGDEVITVSMTFVATTAAILYCGAKPVFVDVDPDTWTMDPKLIEAAITPRTKAILPVHLHGLMADMDPIIEIARRHGLVVIEDAAQSHGAEYKGRRAGSIGDVGCFSFYPGKNLGAYGEGGAAVTNNPELARQMALLRDWGQESKYNHVVPGYNYRMDGIQGAVLNVKMDYIEAWTEARRAVASHYDRLLAKQPLQATRSAAALSACLSCLCHRALRIVMMCKRRSMRRASEPASTIPFRFTFRRPMRTSDTNRAIFLLRRLLADRFLSLPIYAELRPEQVAEVVLGLEKAHLVEAA